MAAEMEVGELKIRKFGCKKWIEVSRDRSGWKSLRRRHSSYSENKWAAAYERLFDTSSNLKCPIIFIVPLN